MYAQRFDLVPQVNVAWSGSNKAGAFPEKSTFLYVLKRATRSNGQPLGDVVPLSQFRSLVDLVPRFDSQGADSRLHSNNSIRFSKEFWLNSYLEKDLFYSLKMY